MTDTDETTKETAGEDVSPQDSDTLAPSPEGPEAIVLEAVAPEEISPEENASGDDAAEEAAEDAADEPAEDGDDSDAEHEGDADDAASEDTASLAANEEDPALTNDDPLGQEAYDLEEGELLEEEAEPVLPWRSRVENPKEFLNSEVHYRYDILEDEDRGKLRGSYRMELRGNKGGVWTLTLGDEVEVVNRREDADVVLTMQARDFLLLINGELNPQLAVLSQKVKLAGEVRKGLTFQTFLAPHKE